MSVFDSYIAAASETSYGTAATVNRFFELSKESVSGKWDRIDSKALQQGQRVLSSGRFGVNPKGADGTLDLEVLDKGFAFWLQYMLGNVAVGTKDANNYTTFTGTIADLSGKSFTLEIGRADVNGGLNLFQYPGGKIKTWEIKNAVDGILELALELSFQKELIRAGSPATVTYPVGAKLFTWQGGTVTLGGTQIPIHDISVKGNNALKEDRFSIGYGRREPREEKMREISFDLKGDFENLNIYNQVSSATASGALASIVLNWTGVTAGGATPAITVTLPAARIDGAVPHVENAKLPELQMTGKALDPGTGAITVTYYSTDTAI
jgi:hypothetical protein